MTFGDIEGLFRIFTAEPDSQGRWSENDIATLVNEAQNYIALQIEFPTYLWTATTTPGTQEYQLQETLKIERVYLAGQACVPTDIATLEGTQIEFYDQSSTTSPQLPAWSTQTAASYPAANTQTGYPNGVSPFYVGQRPQYYVNGGVIGFVPPPIGSYQIAIWGIGVPVPLSAATDVCDFPVIFKSALAHKAAELAFDADSQLEKAQKQGLHFAEWLPKLQTWKRDLVKNKSRGPRPITYRHFYKRGSTLGRGNC